MIKGRVKLLLAPLNVVLRTLSRGDGFPGRRCTNAGHRRAASSGRCHFRTAGRTAGLRGASFLPGCLGRRCRNQRSNRFVPQFWGLEPRDDLAGFGRAEYVCHGPIRVLAGEQIEECNRQ